MVWHSRFIRVFRLLVASPLMELGHDQRSIRFWIDLCRHCARQLRKDRAFQMAAALTYHTLFSILPMIVLAMVVLQAFVGIEERERFKNTVVDTVLPQATIVASADPGDDAKREKLVFAREQMATQVQGLMDSLEDISFRGIGVVGLLVFVFGATLLLATTERSFNSVFGIQHARPWYMRLFVYYTVITLGPILLIFAQVLQIRLFEILQESAWTSWLLGFVALALPVLAAWVAMFAMYVLLPNTEVNKGPAAAGSFVAAILWIFTKELFHLYVTHTGGSTLYGALALLPLLLLWLWLTWVIVLFGLELSYTLQTLKGKLLMEEQARRDMLLVGDPMWLLPIMVKIGKAFVEGKTTDAYDLADDLHLPTRSINEFGQRLEKEGLIHRIEGNAQHGGGFSLAVPPASIKIEQLLVLGRQMTGDSAAMPNQGARQLIDRLVQAQTQTVGDMSLQTVLDETAGNG